MKNVSEKFQIPRYLNPNGPNFFVLPTIKLALPTIKSAFPTIKSPSKLNYQFSIFFRNGPFLSLSSVFYPWV